ncbi:transcription elongation factor GreAB [Bacillus sp. UMB0899]|nr:transcription elongation factor GreAB [Bacillus sp. UMB0899]
MRKYLSIIIIVLVLGLVACSTENSNSTYSGEQLKIGIIGEAPSVKERKVTFRSITFEELEDIKKISATYDAIFITKDNLIKAAEGKYAKVYKTTNIPFFFIQSTKSFLPFINKEVSYEESPDVDNQTYASGIIVNEENTTQWGYGLKDDVLNETNIKDVYTRIFSTIESLKSN